MKPFMLIVFGLIFLVFTLKAQNPLSQKVQTEFGVGISFPFLNGGKELLQSQSLRENGLSYFQDGQGSRKNVGNYGNLIGWSVTTAYYLPIKNVKGLMLGSAFSASLTGSQPSSGGYDQGYFFNFISVGFGGKYYPLTKNNLFVKGDFGLASAFTKNRYINDQNQQTFFHQFGIGTNLSVGIGYSCTPFKNKQKSIDLQAVFQQNNVRVEVNGIGDDQWSYAALNFMLSLNF